MMKMRIHAAQCKPQLSGSSRVYQYIFQHAPVIGQSFTSKKYHPLTDLNVERWKERNIKTWYYTTNLHKGAFMLPRYVEDMLEEEEN